MAENKRLHIQHYYTTGNTVPSADNVKLGEIAVGAGKDNEKLIIKNNENGIVKFLPEGADTSYIKTDGNTSLGENEGGINIDGSTIEIYQGADVSVIISDETGDEKAQLYSYGNYVEATPSGVAISSTSEVAISTNETSVSLHNSGFGIEVKEDGTNKVHALTFNDLGSLKINGKSVLTEETYKGTITGVTAGSGLTGGGSANTGGSGVTLNVGAGTGIAVDENSVSISAEYQGRINKGVEASTKIDAFLKDANMTGDVIDTLVELQGYISSDSGVTQTLLNNVANLQSGLTQAEKDIDNLEDKQVTEATVTGWGFTKNTGTYSKPSGGIPKDDLDSDVQNSLRKADTALQSYTEQYKGTITGITIKALNGLKIVDNNGVISGATGSTSGTIQIKGETANNHGGLGVSMLYNGDLNGMKYQDGAAAAAAHTHSQYLTGYTEQYKGTITGVTAGSGLTGGGSASSGASSVTLDVACGEGLEIDESGYVTLSKIVDREDINEEDGTFCVSDVDDKNAIVSMIGFDEYGRNSGYTLRRITTISCGTF